MRVNTRIVHLGIVKPLIVIRPGRRVHREIEEFREHSGSLISLISLCSNVPDAAAIEECNHPVLTDLEHWTIATRRHGGSASRALGRALSRCEST